MDDRQRREALDIYVTDCFYRICASLGNPPHVRYYDLLHPQPEDTREAVDIAHERLERFGIKVVE